MSIDFYREADGAGAPLHVIPTDRADALCDFLWPLFRKDGEWLDPYGDRTLDLWQLDRMARFIRETPGGRAFEAEAGFFAAMAREGGRIHAVGE